MACRERLRQKLAQQGKLEDSNEGRSCPLDPPKDPKILVMLQDAQATWEEDRKKATVLFRLAARKGYVPAMVLLVSKAQAANDEALLVEALCEALLHKEAALQLPKSMLSNYADQVSILLRKPDHASALKQHQEELRKLGHNFPVLLFLQSASEKEDTWQEIRRLCAPSRPADVGEAEAAESPGGTVGDLAAAQASTKDLAAEIMKLDRQIVDAQAAASEIDALKAGEVNSSLLDTLRKQTEPAPPKQVRGTWDRSESGWTLSATIPSLKSLEEGNLQIADDEIRLSGPGGEILVREPIPNGTCAEQADPQWSEADKKFTLFVPTAPARKVCLMEID